MICPNCNKNISDDSSFCPECGKSLENIQISTNQVLVKKSIQSYKKPITIVIGLLAVVLIFFIISKLIKPTINLSEYISVTFSGYDTVGKAEVEFNIEKFQDKYKGKLPRDFSDEYIEYQLDKDNNLSNGDTVTLTWDCNDEEVLSRYSYKLKYEEISFPVTDLQEIEDFDPFDGINVIFGGISTEGSATLVRDPVSIAAQELTYSLDLEDSLANGDIVTVSATAYGSDPTRYCIENYGLKPSYLTKEYTVSGLDEYISNLSQITNESLEKMQKQAMDVLNAYVANSWDEDQVFQGADYQGSYLLTTKDEEAYDEHNYLYLVYKVQVAHSYENKGTTYNKIDEMYWYIEYTDLIVDSDGNITVDLLSYDTTSNQIRFHPDPDRHYWYWWYYGYLTLDELFNDVVTAKLAEYSYEDGITIN